MKLSKPAKRTKMNEACNSNTYAPTELFVNDRLTIGAKTPTYELIHDTMIHDYGMHCSIRSCSMMVRSTSTNEWANYGEQPKKS